MCVHTLVSKEEDRVFEQVSLQYQNDFISSYIFRLAAKSCFK